MKLNIFKIFISICLIVLCYIFCYYLHKQDCVEDLVKEVLVIKEKIVRDTIFSEKPVYINKLIVRTDTVLLYDIKQDSVLVELPYIRKEYRDSTYSAWVSGYLDVNLDSIRIFLHNKIVLINNQIERIKYKNKHWHIGPSVGVGYDFTNNRVAPYLGVSVQYSIFSW